MESYQEKTENLTREEMMLALREGKKVTHRLFSYNEWMRLSYSDVLVFEDGVHLTLIDFFSNRNEKEWSDGYSIYGTKNT